MWTVQGNFVAIQVVSDNLIFSSFAELVEHMILIFHPSVIFVKLCFKKNNSDFNLIQNFASAPLYSWLEWWLLKW